MPDLLRASLSFVILGIAVALLAATSVSAAEKVDVELVLAVDVSLSMSPMELEIQRHGYAAAFKSKEVADAIIDGAYGKIAVTYFEWAGQTVQRVVVPWTVIASAEDASRFADQLSAVPPNSARRTSISGALEFGADLFAESDFSGDKRVIDISGDGPNNQGAPVTAMRDAAVAQGIVINGLPLMTSGGLSTMYDVKDLDSYYRDCVIGGPGAFVVPVNDWPQFPEAVRRKLVLELANTDTPVEAAASSPELPVLNVQARPAYDCLVGEKMWRDRTFMWEQR